MGSHPCDGINSMGRYQLVDIVRDFAKLCRTSVSIVTNVNWVILYCFKKRR
jgi:hypothetical protein